MIDDSEVPRALFVVRTYITSFDKVNHCISHLLLSIDVALKVSVDT